MKKEIKELLNIIDKYNHIVFFTGAGVSTESGIPDFRSSDGIYNSEYHLPPEKIISHSFFKENPIEFYKFYKNKMIYPNIKPNIVHLKIAELEKQGKCDGVITQNIDGLHQKANSKNIIELHGSIYRNYCTNCHKFYPLEKIINSNDLPICDCKNLIKPDVILYEEALKESDLLKAVELINNADVLIILGTSLVVYPAAGLIRYFKGDKLIIVNKDKTPYDNQADIIINDYLNNVFKYL